MTLPDDVCYRALSSHDARFDGRFFVGVTSTGVYCRPVCPARTPMRRNCRFFSSAAGAEGEGFRPCLRCRPETSPGTPAWLGTSATVSRALRMIEAGALVDADVDSLADRLGVGARHLRRLFDIHLGASPIAVEQTRRVHFAKKLLDETRLPVTEVAFSAGFNSIRRFNATMLEIYGRNPRELRRLRPGAGSNGTSQLVLRLAYRPPFDWQQVVDFFSDRATPGVEVVDSKHYRRSVALGEFRGIIEIRPGDGDFLELRVPRSAAPILAPIVERVRDIFDLGADPLEIGCQLGGDPLLKKLVRRRPGLRVPGAWDRFEVAVRGILGQQVTVRGATTLAGRLVREFGEPLEDADGEIAWLFPRPEVLAEADVSGIGMPRARAAAIRSLAAAVVTGLPALSGGCELDEAIAQLGELRGIGDWTAHYIAMRALREPDAFPASDLGLRRALGNGNGLASAKAVLERGELWRPWRAYAAVHVWMAEVSAPKRNETNPEERKRRRR
jgi:AraC family transcriptional regulator of adaptative response / DNA-3-methyladenine glycosylase II